MAPELSFPQMNANYEPNRVTLNNIQFTYFFFNGNDEHTQNMKINNVSIFCNIVLLLMVLLSGRRLSHLL